MPFGHFLEAPREWMAGNTRKHFQNNRPALGKLKLSRLTPAHLQALYAAKLRGGKKPAGVRQMHAILHKALEQAVRFNLIPTNPASKVDPPKVRQEEITPLTAEQANKLLDVIRNEGDPFEALYFLALTTGLRIGRVARTQVDRHRPRRAPSQGVKAAAA